MDECVVTSPTRYQIVEGTAGVYLIMGHYTYNTADGFLFAHVDVQVPEGEPEIPRTTQVWSFPKPGESFGVPLYEGKPVDAITVEDIDSTSDTWLSATVATVGGGIT